MFRTVPLSNTKSFSQYTQQWYTLYRFADSLQTGSGWSTTSNSREGCLRYNYKNFIKGTKRWRTRQGHVFTRNSESQHRTTNRNYLALFHVLTSVVVGSSGDRSVILCAERKAICSVPRSERFTATTGFFRRCSMCKLIQWKFGYPARTGQRNFRRL